VEAEVREHRRLQQVREQMEREKRLSEAQRRSIQELNTARRQTEKEDKRNRVVGKLSVIIGNNRKGEIIIRNGDNLKANAKNFVTSYGLKKEFVPTIVSSLE